MAAALQSSSPPGHAAGMSQNHRMVGVGRDLCGSSSPNPLPKQGCLQQAAQDLVQAGLLYLQRRRLHNLPGQPVPGLCHPHSEMSAARSPVLCWQRWVLTVHTVFVSHQRSKTGCVGWAGVVFFLVKTCKWCFSLWAGERRHLRARVIPSSREQWKGSNVLAL